MKPAATTIDEYILQYPSEVKAGFGKGRVKGKGDVHEVDLVDVVQLVFAVSGEGMYHEIGHSAIMLPNKGQRPRWHPPS